MKTARLEFTAFLDVLTIVMLALLLQKQAESAAMRSDMEDLQELADNQAATTADALERANEAQEARIAAESAQEAAAERAERAEERAETAEQRAETAEQRAEAAEVVARGVRALNALSPEQKRLTMQLLTAQLTLVNFTIENDTITRAVRFGEDQRIPLDVGLTVRRSTDGGPPSLVGAERIFERIQRVVTTALAPSEVSDPVIHVFSSDTQTTCAALLAVRAAYEELDSDIILVISDTIQWCE